MANTYCTATNFGKGFFTHEDRNDFYLSGHAGDVWVIGNNAAGVSWINRVSGTAKTKAEAQAIVDGKVEEAQVAYDAESAEYKAKHSRPVKYILPQDLTMATYKGIKGVKVVTKTSDPTASEATGTVWYNSTGVTLKYATQGTGAWATGTNFPASVNQAGGAGTLTTYLAWGGSDPGDQRDETFKYDGTTWTAANSRNLKISGTSGLGTQTAALGAGGYNTSLSPVYTNACEEFDGTCWATANVDSAKPSVGYIGLTGTQTAGLSVAGYGSPPGQVSVCSEYDGTNWTTTSAYPAAMSNVFSFGIQTAAIGVGGAPPYTTNGFDYDGTSWSAGDSINTGRTEGAQGGINTSAMIAGGGTPTLSAKTEKYDGSSWTEVGDLGTARSLSASGYSSVSGVPTAFICVTGSVPAKSNVVEEWTDPVYTVKTVTVS